MIPTATTLPPRLARNLLEAGVTMRYGPGSGAGLGVRGRDLGRLRRSIANGLEIGAVRAV